MVLLVYSLIPARGDEMEEIILDSEIADIVFQTYQKINALRRVLNEQPFPEMKKIIGSGDDLNELMNRAIDQRTREGLESKLMTLSTHLDSLVAQTGIFQHGQPVREIGSLFDQVKRDVSTLQSRIHAQK